MQLQKTGTLVQLKSAIDRGETAELHIITPIKGLNVLFHVLKTKTGYTWNTRGIPKNLWEPDPVEKKDSPHENWKDLLASHDEEYITSKQWTIVQ